MENKRSKKIGNIVLNILLCIFIVICICSVVMMLVSQKTSDGAVEMFGYQMRIVVSDSMAKCDQTDVSDFDIGAIPVRSMVFVKTMPDDPAEADEWYRSLKVGDVLTFRYVYATQVTITHRITSITEKDTGGFVIELAGDNKSSDSEQMYQKIDTSVPNNTNYVIGKVTGQAYIFGAVMSFLTQPIGTILCIILPCVIIALLEAFRIAKVLLDEKKKRQDEEAQNKQREIDELRRKIAELETQKEELLNATQSEATVSDESKADSMEEN